MRQEAIEPMVCASVFSFENKAFLKTNLVESVKISRNMQFGSLPKVKLIKHLLLMFCVKLIEDDLGIYPRIFGAFEKHYIPGVLAIYQASYATYRVCHLPSGSAQPEKFSSN
jgi:hypothetical protein